MMERLLGRSILWAEGDQHKRQRQMLNPVFTHERVKLMDEEIRTAANKLVVALQEYIHSQSSITLQEKRTDTVSINALDWTSRATLDIIGSIGFGHDFQLGKSPEAQTISKSWRQQAELGMTLPGFILPLLIRLFPIIATLPVKAIQAQGETRSIIKRLGRNIVEQRRNLEDGGETKGKDLLSAIMKIRETHGESLDNQLDHVGFFCHLK